MRTIICVLGMMCICSACTWHEAKEVIATADSLDQTEHVIYDDTAALSEAIRCLDNPFGRLFMRSTLGKAYYYMGRNYSLSNQIPEAADCYINADRLQIDDPIYRGRVNTNMGYICTQNNNDSLALIFYERASEDFKESGNEWRYAQMLLTVSHHCINLHHFLIADSLLQVAQTYSLDSAYQARYYETRGLYHYEQQQYDSALVYLQRGLEYWQTEEDKCFSYLKMLQIYLDMDALDKALPFAHFIVKESNNPNYLVNAYYCLMQDAKRKNNTELLSQYSHARTDAQRLLRNAMLQDIEALPKLEEYLSNPHPLRWVWITIAGFALLSSLLFIGIMTYRKHTAEHLNNATSRLQETNILLQAANETIDNLSTRMREKELTEKIETKASYSFNKSINTIRSEFPAPSNKWNDYHKLKKDIDPWLHNWLCALDQLNLSDREKILCVYTLLYPHLSTAKLANYMNYQKDGIRVFKSRIVQRLGIKSSELPAFLQNLSIKG